MGHYLLLQEELADAKKERDSYKQKFLDAVELCNQLQSEKDIYKKAIEFIYEECDWEECSGDDRIGNACCNALARIKQERKK